MPSSKAAIFDPKAFLANVGTGKKVLRIPRERSVFSQGDPADTLLYLQQGRVRTVVLNDGGKEAVIDIVDAGEFFVLNDKLQGEQQI